MRAINIQWDVDEPEELEFLPTEIEIPDDIARDYEYEDEITDYISDTTGFCVYGYDLVD